MIAATRYTNAILDTGTDVGTRPDAAAVGAVPPIAAATATTISTALV